MKHSARISLRGYAWAAVTVLAVLAYAPGAWSRVQKRAVCHVMTEALAKALFDEWNGALQVRPVNPDKVVQTYTLGAVLLPTFQSGPLIGRDQIRGYFVHFLEQHPFGRIDTRAVLPAACNIGTVAGLYTFTVDEGTSRVDKAARYTFVYVYKQEKAGGRWLIEHHHSSARPPKAAAE